MYLLHFIHAIFSMPKNCWGQAYALNVDPTYLYITKTIMTNSHSTLFCLSPPNLKSLNWLWLWDRLQLRFNFFIGNSNQILANHDIFIQLTAIDLNLQLAEMIGGWVGRGLLSLISVTYLIWSYLLLNPTKSLTLNLKLVLVMFSM